MRRNITALLTIIAGFVYLGCSGSGGGGSATVGVFAFRLANGPCSDVAPLGWAASGSSDDRTNAECDTTSSELFEPALGPADGNFISMGPDSGNCVVLELDTNVVDGPDYDLVIYEVQTGEDDAHYNVYLSGEVSVGFTKIATVDMEGTYCIDLAGSGISEGRYVKIEQISNADSVGGVCDSTYGADIDAIGILNIDPCMNFEDACEYVGMKVDEMCPPDDDYRNHGAYVSCVAHAATSVIRAMDLDECFGEDDLDDVHGCVVSKRAQSDVGKP